MFFGESVSPIVYHYTQLLYGREVLKRMEFRLASSYSNGDEDMHRPKPSHHYYMSVTRNPSGSYHGASREGVIFVLDGNYFNRRYRSQPVDFFAAMAAKSKDEEPLKAKGSELEDRIFSDKPTIPITKDAILEIHISTPGLRDTVGIKSFVSTANAIAKEIWIMAKKLGIPVWLYDSSAQNMIKRSGNRFSLLDKASAVTPEDLGFTVTTGQNSFRHFQWTRESDRWNWGVPFGRKPMDDLARLTYSFRQAAMVEKGLKPRKADVLGPTQDVLIIWRELYHKKSFKELSTVTQRELIRFFGGGWTRRQFVQLFESHWAQTITHRTEGSVASGQKMIEILRKMKVTIDEFPDKMYDKWAPIYEKEVGKINGS